MQDSGPDFSSEVGAKPDGSDAELLRLLVSREPPEGEGTYIEIAKKLADIDTEIGEKRLLAALEEIRLNDPDVRILAGAAQYYFDIGSSSNATHLGETALGLRPIDLFISSLCAKLRAARFGTEKDKAIGFCTMPFEHFQTDADGSIYLCCSGWLPKPIGNIKEQPWKEIWNSEAAQEVRQSIHDGSYRYCDALACAFLSSRSLPAISEIADPRLRAIAEEGTTIIDEPTKLNFAHDYSCNLACPSCRSELVVAKGKVREELVRMEETLLDLIDETNSTVSMTSSGDPFGSQHFRKLIKSMKKTDKPRLLLMTNGVLFDRRAWDELDLDGKVKAVRISMDASSKDVYSVVRRLGDFDVLLDNLRFVADLRRKGKIEHFMLDYVVQAQNFRDIPGYVGIARGLGVDNVAFAPIFNWGTFSPAEFAKQIIWSVEHPEFEEFLAILRNPALRWPGIWWGALSDVVEYALRTGSEASAQG